MSKEIFVAPIINLIEFSQKDMVTLSNGGTVLPPSGGWEDD